MKTFLSAAEHISMPLDCRRLTLSIQFYQLTQSQVSKFCSCLMRWIYEIAGTDCIFSWMHNGKTVSSKRIWHQVDQPFPSERGLSVFFDAYVRSGVVYNRQSMLKYIRYIQTLQPMYEFGWNEEQYLDAGSTDFQAYWKELFHDGRPDNAELVRRIHMLFDEPNRKFLALHDSADLYGRFSATPYSNNPDFFYGTACISFGAFCLNDSLDEMADEFLQYAQELAKSFVHLNLHVMLQPVAGDRSPYMRYFGKHIVADDSHIAANQSIDEWYPTYYLCGVEWANILSPLVQQHIPDKFPVDFNSDIVQVKKIDGGCLLVKSQKSITGYAMSDALALKDILWPMLYPGQTSVPLRSILPKGDYRTIFALCPRSKWEIVPMSEHEIAVIGTDLVYRSINSLR